MILNYILIFVVFIVILVIMYWLKKDQYGGKKEHFEWYNFFTSGEPELHPETIKRIELENSVKAMMDDVNKMYATQAAVKNIVLNTEQKASQATQVLDESLKVVEQEAATKMSNIDNNMAVFQEDVGGFQSQVNNSFLAMEETVGTQNVQIGQVTMTTNDKGGFVIGTSNGIGDIQMHSNRFQMGKENPNIVVEGGRTSDGNNLGFSAINFNGEYNRGEVRGRADKSRYRIYTEQRAHLDKMGIDQLNPAGVRRDHVSIDKDGVNVTSRINGALKVHSGASKPGIVIEGGTTSDGNPAHTGFSAINFNGEYNNGEIRHEPSKSRWRIYNEQRGGHDLMGVDQLKPNGQIHNYVTLNNDKAIINKDVVVNAGNNEVNGRMRVGWGGTKNQMQLSGGNHHAARLKMSAHGVGAAWRGAIQADSGGLGDPDPKTGKRAYENPNPLFIQPEGGQLHLGKTTGDWTHPNWTPTWGPLEGKGMVVIDDAAKRLDTAGSIRSQREPNKAGIVIEGGTTSDGNPAHTGFSAINFNGEYNNGEIRHEPSKSRWRIYNEQRGGHDLMGVDQLKPNGQIHNYVTLKDDKAIINKDVTVNAMNNEVNGKMRVGWHGTRDQMHLTGGSHHLSRMKLSAHGDGGGWRGSIQADSGGEGNPDPKTGKRAWERSHPLFIQPEGGQLHLGKTRDNWMAHGNMHEGTGIVVVDDVANTVTSSGSIRSQSAKGKTGIVIEGGNTTDGDHPGFSAINFNGEYNKGEVRHKNDKSRFRMLTEQRGPHDFFALDQWKPDNTWQSHMTIDQNWAHMRTPNTAVHGNLHANQHLYAGSATVYRGADVHGGLVSHGKFTANDTAQINGYKDQLTVQGGDFGSSRLKVSASGPGAGWSSSIQSDSTNEGYKGTAFSHLKINPDGGEIHLGSNANPFKTRGEKSAVVIDNTGRMNISAKDEQFSITGGGHNDSRLRLSATGPGAGWSSVIQADSTHTDHNGVWLGGKNSRLFINPEGGDVHIGKRFGTNEHDQGLYGGASQLNVNEEGIQFNGPVKICNKDGTACRTL